MNIRLRKNPANRFVLAGFLAALGAGCSPEGAGTIKIENPDAVRAKIAGPTESSGKETPKEAKAKAIEAEAAKKQPKLQ